MNKVYKLTVYSIAFKYVSKKQTLQTGRFVLYATNNN